MEDSPEKKLIKSFSLHLTADQGKLIVARPRPTNTQPLPLTWACHLSTSQPRPQGFIALSGLKAMKFLTSQCSVYTVQFTGVQELKSSLTTVSQTLTSLPHSAARASCCHNSRGMELTWQLHPSCCCRYTKKDDKKHQKANKKEKNSEPPGLHAGSRWKFTEPPHQGIGIL